MEWDPAQDAIIRTLDKFATVQKLLNDNKDPVLDTEPFNIKYKAIEILKEVEVELAEAVNNLEKKDDRTSIVRAVIHMNLGLLHSDTEELKAAELQFMKCVDLLRGREKDPEAIIPLLSALNQLGIIWSQWGESSTAKKFLDEAEEYYKKYMVEGPEFKEPVSMTTLLGSKFVGDEPNPIEILDKLHTLTLFYLAQVYGTLKDHHKSAVYCHMTLRRQLGHGDIMTDLDYVEWALNAATLSQYLMEVNGFPQARHHLAAASHILKKYEGLLKEKYKDTEENDVAKAEWDRLRHRSADIARCWAKYGILLMMLSKERLMEKIAKDEQDDEKDATSTETSKSVEDLKFDQLEKEIEPIEKQITDKYLLDFDDARPVFLNAQKWLDEAKAFYTLEDHASDHVAIVQDMSLAYKYLVFFEEHEDRQAKMHKRRIDILENIIKELNPQYYKAVCRELWLELGETYSQIIDIKVDRMRLEDKPTTHAIAKINNLAAHAIGNYQAFLDSVENHRPDNPSLKLPEDVENAVLNSYFHIGRLHHKITAPDKGIQIGNIQHSIKAYQYLIDYGKKYPKSVESMKEKYSLCQELLILLPPQINRLKQQMNKES